MKFIVNAPPGMTEEDLKGLLRGYAAATATAEAQVKELDNQRNIGRKGEDSLSMAFNLLIIPFMKIDGMLLDKSNEAKKDGGIAKFAVEMTAKEYAVAHYIANQLNPPF